MRIYVGAAKSNRGGGLLAAQLIPYVINHIKTFMLLLSLCGGQPSFPGEFGSWPVRMPHQVGNTPTNRGEAH